MNTKKRTAMFDNNTIDVVNTWNLIGDTSEKIYINDKLVHAIDKIMHDDFREVVGARYMLQHENHTIEVEFGSAWHLFGLACRISINQKRI